MKRFRKQTSEDQQTGKPQGNKKLTSRQKKGILIGGGIILVVVIALILVKNLTGGAKDGENVLYADSVGMITGTGLGTQNRFTGVVEAQDTLKINLADNQKVKEIFVEKGQEVEPGTKLFEYDTEELAMTLEQGKLELEKITNNIDSLKSQVAALTTEKKSAPASEQLSYTTQIQEIQMNIKEEEYNYKVKELEVNRTQKSLEESTVTSTVSGIVQEINQQPGTDTYSGTEQAFMSILSTGKYRIKGKISEQNIGDLTPGTQVTIRSRVNEDEIWTGTVDNVDTEKPESSSQDSMYSGTETSDNQATKYPFYVTLDTMDGLMLGQHVYVETSTTLEADKIWLMRDYIVDAGSDNPYVWVAGENDKLEKRSVSLGETNEEMGTCEIISGLKATDYIVWPSEECKKGAAVVKNNSGAAGRSDSSSMDMDGESSADGVVEESTGQEAIPGMEEGLDE